MDIGFDDCWESWCALLSTPRASQISSVVHKTIGYSRWCTQILLPVQLVVTIFVATVQLIHNFEIVANNSHILNNVYKNGSIFISSHRISMVVFVAKDGSKMYYGYNLVCKIPLATKVYTSPLPGYIFGYICQLCTQFIAV